MQSLNPAVQQGRLTRESHLVEWPHLLRLEREAGLSQCLLRLFLQAQPKLFVASKAFAEALGQSQFTSVGRPDLKRRLDFGG